MTKREEEAPSFANFFSFAAFSRDGPGVEETKEQRIDVEEGEGTLGEENKKEDTEDGDATAAVLSAATSLAAAVGLSPAQKPAAGRRGTIMLPSADFELVDDLQSKEEEEEDDQEEEAPELRKKQVPRWTRSARQRENYEVPAELAFSFSRAEADRVRRIFGYFDKDGSGAIDAGEIADALEAVGMEVLPGEVERLVAEADADGNGEIDFGEFCHMMAGRGGGLGSLLGRDGDDHASALVRLAMAVEQKAQRREPGDLCYTPRSVAGVAACSDSDGAVSSVYAEDGGSARRCSARRRSACVSTRPCRQVKQASRKV